MLQSASIIFGLHYLCPFLHSFIQWQCILLTLKMLFSPNMELHVSPHCSTCFCFYLEIILHFFFNSTKLFSNGWCSTFCTSLTHSSSSTLNLNAVGHLTWSTVLKSTPVKMLPRKGRAHGPGGKLLGFLFLTTSSKSKTKKTMTTQLVKSIHPKMAWKIMFEIPALRMWPVAVSPQVHHVSEGWNSLG